VFDSAAPPAITDQEGYGTLTLQFDDCESGLATYTIPSLNLSGEIALQRIVEDRVTLCEALAAP